jgi:hypothetical protein
MKNAGIRITRYPYEEPYHLNLRIAASNGRIDGDLEYYCNANDLGVLGKKLASFAGREAVTYELGSEKPEDRFAFYLSLQVMALDSRGHCAVVLRLSNNGAAPDREVSEFAIKADVADVNRLGRLFEEFGRLGHRVLDWRVQHGRLFKDDEERA